MLLSKEAKNISDLVRRGTQHIRPVLTQAFGTSILSSSSEVIFFRNLINQLSTSVSSLGHLGLNVWCRYAEIHQKPIVRFKRKRCELGDLLVVVKYHLSNGATEVKSIIYQIKLSQSNSTLCKIDQVQLELLCDWTTFTFGRKATGYNTFSIKPKTLEFGSFMLEPRSPTPGQNLKFGCYGTCPYAELVRNHGGLSVDLSTLPYTRGDASNFFSHIAFEIGEHHQNRAVKRLVDTLYRYVGLSPDPPREFEDFSKVVEDDGFAIIEINLALAGVEITESNT